MIQVNNTATYDDCSTWVEKIFGEAERQRFARLLENNSNTLSRELTDEEINSLYNEFNNNLYCTMFTRQGK